MRRLAPPSTVISRTVTAYRVENLYVDYKIINNIPMPIPIYIFIC